MSSCFRKSGVPSFGVLIQKRILLFGVLYWSPLLSETPPSHLGSGSCGLSMLQKCVLLQQTALKHVRLSEFRVSHSCETFDILFPAQGGRKYVKGLRVEGFLAGLFIGSWCFAHYLLTRNRAASTKPEVYRDQETPISLHPWLMKDLQSVFLLCTGSRNSKAWLADCTPRTLAA